MMLLPIALAMTTMPVIEAQDEQGEPGQRTISGASNLAGVR